MLSHEINPTIYIGLGGSGIRSMAFTKKMYEDEFGVGKIPPQIAFLAIDSDYAMENSPLLPTDISQDFVKLHLNDKLQDDKGNKVAEGVGAGGSPRKGGILAEHSYEVIMSKLIHRYKRVLNTSCGNRYVDVRMALSIAGGTGAGAVLAVAHIVKEALGDGVRLYGYGMNYGVYSSSDTAIIGVPFSFLNAYSTVLGIDYTMHASSEQPKEVSFNNLSKVIYQPYFNQFYIVDNNSETLVLAGDISQLCFAVGMAMYLSSNNRMNNYDAYDWRNGAYDINNKRGWVYGLGCCQIVYKGDELAEIYKLRAIKFLASSFGYKYDDIDFDKCALEWTMRHDVQIREDGVDYTSLMDSIFPADEIRSIKSLVCLSVKDSYETTFDKVGRYVNDLSRFPGQQTIKERERLLISLLNTEVEHYLNAGYGVRSVRLFLDKLQNLCEEAICNRNNEITEISHIIQSMNNALHSCEYIRKRNSILWHFRSNGYKESLLEEMEHLAYSIVRQKYELMRRNVAVKILKTLVFNIKIFIERVGHTGDILFNIMRYCDEQSDLLIKKCMSPLPFECNLSLSDFNNMIIEESDLSRLDSFSVASTLRKPLYEYSESDLMDELLYYADSLAGANKYKETDIMRVIERMDAKERAAFEKEVASKSEIMLNLDGKGQIIKRGVLNKSVPVLDSMVSELNVVYYHDGEDYDFEFESYFLQKFNYRYFHRRETPSLKQKIMVYRSAGAIIPYCLRTFSDHLVKLQFGDTVGKEKAFNFNMSCDRTAFEWMQKNNFSLKPMSEMEMYPPLPCPSPKLPF